MSNIIYQPKGKAKEYSPWAANFYNGCSNRCDYCYNRHCQAKALLGKDEPTLKKSLLSEENAIKVFKHELGLYKDRILKDGKGLFFNFVSDPMLPETVHVNMACIVHAIQSGVPCVVLTKRADWYYEFEDELKTCKNGSFTENLQLAKEMIKFGFTLTGCDELEHCGQYSTNQRRMSLMELLHRDGFKVWASIEPVIDVHKSWDMIINIYRYCDELKIGLLSGKKEYTKEDVKWLVSQVCSLSLPISRVYFKDSITDFIK